jgi:hypothetical protein
MPYFPLPPIFQQNKASFYDAYQFARPLETIDLSLECAVAIVPTAAPTIQLSFFGDRKDLQKCFEIEQTQTEFKLRQKPNVTVTSQNNVCRANGAIVSVQGRSVRISASGGTISMINGRVFVNGVEVGLDGNDEQSAPAPKSEVAFVIEAPSDLKLIAAMSGQNGLLVSNVPHSGAQITASASAKAFLRAAQLVVEASSSASVKGQIVEGAAVLNASSSGSINIAGAFASVAATVSSAAKIATEGQVTGLYAATANSAGRIHHQGHIGGPVLRQESSNGRVSFG